MVSCMKWAVNIAHKVDFVLGFHSYRIRRQFWAMCQQNFNLFFFCLLNEIGNLWVRKIDSYQLSASSIPAEGLFVRIHRKRPIFSSFFLFAIDKNGRGMSAVAKSKLISNIIINQWTWLFPVYWKKIQLFRCLKHVHRVLCKMQFYASKAKNVDKKIYWKCRSSRAFVVCELNMCAWRFKKTEKREYIEKARDVTGLAYW